MANHLAGETSPYLLQHAHNPVDWHPWGAEALTKAASEEKPIFLSIGYSACHWCHVMERESFTDESTAALLNQHFISIKVDREERPDLDSIYMDAVAALTGGGGWPLSVWLTPEGAPFYGGTYFPDRPRYGMPSFKQVLTALAEAWRDRREDLQQGAARLVERLRAADERRSPRTAGTDATAAGAEQMPLVHEQAAAALTSSFDPEHGGWGSAPKFPQPVLIEYLLTRHALSPEPNLWEQVEQTLDAMARGGIYDHLGGGFHRYATDDEWLVPHFEKMLYDNAQLALCYLHAWQLCGHDRYLQVTRQTLDYLLRDMRHPEGAFYCAEDADSEGEEGRFYVWSDDEVGAARPPEEAAALRRAYGVTPTGNFEGRSILKLVEPPQTEAEAVALAAAKARLLEVRATRVRPGRDDKVLASWNGLALAAFAEAGRVLDDATYLSAAVTCATFLLEHMVRDDRRIVHSWKDGTASAAGFLEDHALVADGMLALYQATFDERWYDCARGLLDSVPVHFARPGGGFYDTSSDHEALFSRPRDTTDNPLPCGNSAAALGFLRLAAYSGEGRYWDLWLETVDTAEDVMARAPGAFANWLRAHLLGHAGLRELALVGDPDSPAIMRFQEIVASEFRPDLVLAGRAPEATSGVELLHNRPPAAPGVTAGTADVAATAWLCRGTTCSAPLTDPGSLAKALAVR